MQEAWQIGKFLEFLARDTATESLSAWSRASGLLDLRTGDDSPLSVA